MPAAFESEQLRAIAGGARTLHERLADPSAIEPAAHEESAVEETFETWRELFPDEEAFAHRLDRDGLTEADCRRAIAADRLAADEPLPAWVDRLDEVVTSVLASDPGDQPDRLGPRRSDDDEDVAEREFLFAPLSAAVASFACDRLPDDPVRDALSEPVVGRLAEWFRNRFDYQFARMFYVEFKTFVAAHDPELAEADPEEFDDPPTAYYEAFLDFLFSGGLVEFCTKYPVFARLLVTQIRQFDELLREFVRRLDADRDTLADRFGDGEDLGAVTDVEPLAEDTHGDGRAVMRVAFESGVEVAYKPRSVDAGETFYRLFDRLDDHLPTPDFETPTYLCRDGYGWMEWVEEADCADGAAVERYYRRAGVLTCVAYLLELWDCQFQNLLVAGEQPTLVDAETVCHPYVGADRRPLQSSIGALVDDSVLLTLLLPYGLVDPNGEGVDGSRTTAGFSLTAGEVEMGDLELPHVTAVDTDVMSVEYEPVRIDRRGDVPSVDGTPHPPGEYIEEFVDGFETTYETVLDLRDDDRLAELGFPDALASVENRVVYRSTKRYGGTIHSLTSRECLADGARFGVEMETLAVPFFDGTVADPVPWGIFDAECRTLARFDPPRFASRTDDTAIRLGDSPTGVDADRPGIERARDRIAAADRADMRAQVELVRSAFGALPNPRQPAGSAGREAASDDEFRGEARALFEDVREAALETADGDHHWASVEPMSGPDGPEPLTIQPASGSLYVGRPGIALFGAALYHVTGEDRYREFALTTLDPLRDALDTGLELVSLRSHGGTGGVGGLAYGFAAVGDLLGREALVETAAGFAESVTDDLVEADDTYDVIGGSAGTILGLLAVHDRHENPGVLSAARACGDHLLEERVEVAGTRAWKAVDDRPPLTGFSHGTAGIAYALVRLWGATGEDRYRTAALDALAHEDANYLDDEHNWRDFREWTGPALDQWCHGRSGVGLARLGMAAYVDDDRVTRGVTRAVDGFPEDGLGEMDHLCCGDAGRAEFLLEAERRRGRLAGEARALLGGVLARKREAGYYRTLSYTREILDPTFFHGVSGIGYAMLRVVEPELPCALLWE